MKLRINGEEIEIPDGLTIQELLRHLKLFSGPVAVEQNQEVVPRDKHESTLLSEGDAVEIVHFVGGG